MAGDPGSCGTAAIIFYRHKKKPEDIYSIGLLGNKKLSVRAEKKLPGMGVSTGSFMLVREWHYLSRQSAERLAPKDESMQKMRLFRIHL